MTMNMILVSLVLIIGTTLGKQHEVPLFEALSYHYNATPSLIVPLWVENMLGKQAIFTSKHQRDATGANPRNPIALCSMEVLGIVSGDAPSRGNAKLYIDGTRSGDNSWRCFYRTIKVLVSNTHAYRIPFHSILA